MRARRLAVILAVAVLSTGSGFAQEDIRVPNGIDLSRIRKIDEQFEKLRRGNERAANEEAVAAHKLRIYAVVKSIDAKDAHVLVPEKMGSAVGNAIQLRERFKTTISATNRFDFRDDTQTSNVEGIVAEVTITAANQDLLDYRAFLKSVTTVRASVSIKDLDTGRVIRSRNLNAVYGSEPDEGTKVTDPASIKEVRPGVCQAPHVCANLANDYGKAMQELMETLAAYIEKTFRPIARVTQVEADGTITMLGSINHGFNAEEELVVFRLRRQLGDDGKPTALPPTIKAIALAQCSVGDSLTCRVVKGGRNGDVQPGDYAVPSDRMMVYKE